MQLALPRFVRHWLGRVRHHAEAERRLLPGLYRPWRRVICGDGSVVAQRRRRDGTVADTVPWGDYLALRNRHREFSAGSRAYIRKNRRRWVLGGLLGLMGLPRPFRP